jgi:aminopeptidase N
MLRILILVSFLAASFVLYAQVQSPRPVDVKSYVYEVALSDANDSIGCKAVVSFEVMKPSSSFSFDLTSIDKDGKGMRVTSVTGENGKALSFSHASDVLKINAGTSATVGSVLIYKIAYRGVPANGLVISRNKYNRRTFFSDHWPNRAHHWLVCVDHPSDKASVEFSVSAPSHYQVVSNGIRIEESDLGKGMRLTRWRETDPLPTKVMALGVAEFSVGHAGESECVEVQSWLFPEDRVKGFHDYSIAAEVLPFFQKNLAPYPFEKLANVESKTIFAGMENASAIYYPETSVTGNRTIVKLVAHEIAHQYFGNTVTETDWPHLWLSEGFADYFSWMYLESAYGRDSMVAELKKSRDLVVAFAAKRSTPVVDSSTTDYLQLLNANSYDKGSWVLHMLRQQLGDSLFWSGLRSYYAQYAGKNASTNDFRMVMERTSGRNLATFFRQWLYTAGHPKLQIEWRYDVAAKAVKMTVRQMQDNVFEFPLLTKLVGGDGLVMKSVRVHERETTISIPMIQAPTRVEVDPNTQLLFEGTVREMR